MSYESERLKILEMIDNGLITVDEGVLLLKALEQHGADASVLPETSVEPTLTPRRKTTTDFVGLAETPTASIPTSEIKGVLNETLANKEELSEESGTEGAVYSQAEPQLVFPEEQPPAPEGIHTPQPEQAPEEEAAGPQIDPGLKKWRRYWWIPLWVGVGITVVSASLMYVAWARGGFGFWFACTWFPFALGVLVMALAYASRTARWLHVRVHQKPGESPRNISISLPIPLRLTAWFFRTFKGKIPGMGNTGIDELIMALEATNPDTPFYVEVDEGEDGERVEVYIG